MKKTKSQNKPRKEWGNMLFNSAFAIIAVLIIIFFHNNTAIATTLEVILATIGLTRWNSKTTLLIFIFAGIFGAIADMVVISTSQAWNYLSPTFMQLIPIWLFVVYANAGAFIYETAKEIKGLEENK